MKRRIPSLHQADVLDGLEHCRLPVALDVHPRVAMRILRHAQIDVTMNVYTEVSDAKTLQALKRLGS